MIRKKTFPSNGFTLIELMIVVAIVGVLAGIAFPSYQDSIRKGRRGDAKAELSRLAQEQHRLRVTNTTFVNDSTLVTTDSDYYAFLVTANSGTAFTISATPKANGGQNQDICATLTINQNSLITSSDSSSCPTP